MKTQPLHFVFACHSVAECNRNHLVDEWRMCGGQKLRQRLNDERFYWRLFSRLAVVRTRAFYARLKVKDNRGTFVMIAFNLFYKGESNFFVTNCEGSTRALACLVSCEFPNS